MEELREKGPAGPSTDMRAALMQAQALQAIADNLGRLAAVAERLSIDDAIRELAEAVRGQRFATHVTATFVEKD